MQEFELLGKRMIQLGLSAKDLEHRVNALNLPNEQARAVVTGFVNAGLQDRGTSGEEIYGLIRGWGRWLFNGDYTTVMDSTLAKIASEGYELHRFFEKNKDPEGLIKAAELAIEKRPELTHDFYTKEDRPDKLRKIIELHRDNPKYAELITSCYKELKDTDGLRAFAMEQLEKNQELALQILNDSLGTDEDLRLVAANTDDIIFGYNILQRIQQKTDADKAELERLMKEIIETMPERADDFNTKWQEHYHRGEHQRTRIVTNKENMLEIGKSLLKKGQHMAALRTFAEINYTGEYYIQAGLEILQKGNIPYLGDSDYDKRATRMRDQALIAAAVLFFEQGGDPTLANTYIPQNTEDKIQRKLGQALATLPEDKHGWCAVHAYDRMQLIGKKTEEDEQLIQELRRRIINERKEHAGVDFVHAFDKTGLKQFIDHGIDIYPIQVYEAAAKQGSPEDVMRARESLIQKALDGKIRLDKAYNALKEAGDEAGLKYLDGKVAPGVPQEITAKLLAK